MPKEFNLAETRAFFTKTGLCLAKLGDTLPPAMQGSLKEITDDLNVILAKMPPLEQVPAALDASRSLEYAIGALDGAVSSANRLTAMVETLSRDHNAAKVSLNSFEEKVTKGELIPKADAEQATTAAVNAAVAKQVTVFSQRHATLLKCGLPVPTDSTAILGDDAAFATVQKTAENRLAQLKANRISLNGAELADLAYCPEADFQRALGLAKSMGAKVDAPPADPAAPPTTVKKLRLV